MKINVTENQGRVIQSRAEVVVALGSFGTGKTFIGGLRLLALAKERKLKGYIIRESAVVIEQHLLPSLQKGFGLVSDFRSLKSGGFLWTAPNLQATMFGIADLGSLSRLQGAELDFLWLDEVAPISGDSAGLAEDVYDIGLSRLRSGEGETEFYKHLMVTMNPSSEDHWSYRKFVSEKTDDVEVIELNSPEDKAHISPKDRERVAKAFANRPDLYQRYVEGKWGFVSRGVSVTPGYNSDLHMSKSYIKGDKRVKLQIFLDGWHHPAAIFMQRLPNGRVNVLQSLQASGVGVRQFIASHVLPTIGQEYVGYEIEIYGDESMRTPDQSNHDVTAAGVVEELMHVQFNGVTNKWVTRREAMSNLLAQMVDGYPAVQISPACKLLDRALSGGWHYAKLASGVQQDAPVKDQYSHLGDCFSYLAVVMFPQLKARKYVQSVPTLAKSYAIR